MTDYNQALMLALQTGGMYGANQYSQFPSGIQSTAYSGTPTNAMGRPIRAPPGMTLNQTPAQPAAATASNQGQEALGSPARAMQDAGYGDWGMLDPMLADSPIPGQTPGPGSMGYQEANYDKTGPQMMTLGSNGLTPANAPAAAAPPATGGQPTNSYQNALQLLSRPGRITSPGATVPASQPVTNQPSVLDQFLASQHGGTGAGGYSNQGFFDTLNKLRGANAPAQTDANTAPAALSPGANMTNQLAGYKKGQS